MNLAEYEDHISKMPEDHNSQEWLNWLIHNETAAGRPVTVLGNWVKVTNLKYYRDKRELGELPFKNDHNVFFLRGQFNMEAKMQMVDIMTDLQAKGYSCYVNREKSTTIRRFHFHSVNRGISGLILGLIESI